jgi:rsbT co-antagonist protein RsbR
MRCESCLLQRRDQLAQPIDELLRQLSACEDCPFDSAGDGSAVGGGLLEQKLRQAASLVRQQQLQMKKLRNESRELRELAQSAEGRVAKLEQLQKASSREADSELRAKMDLVSRQQAAILELSTPIIQIEEGILVLPLIGTLDDERAANLTQGLLAEIQTARARTAILDLTGVGQLDQRAARLLVQVAQAVRLLGAQVVLSGLRPQVAHQLVGLGIDLGDLKTARSLQDALRHCRAAPR